MDVEKFSKMSTVCGKGHVLYYVQVKCQFIYSDVNYSVMKRKTVRQIEEQ